MFLHGAPGSRREFLVRTGAGFGALAMGALLRSDARGEQPFKPPAIDPLNPFAARKPHFAPKPEQCRRLFNAKAQRREAAKGGRHLMPSSAGTFW